MNTMLFFVSLLQKRLNERVFIDPTNSEEELVADGVSLGSQIGEDRGQITIGYQPSLEQVALMTSEGHMTSNNFIKDVKTLAKLSSKLVQKMQLCLVESVKNNIQG